MAQAVAPLRTGSSQLPSPSQPFRCNQRASRSDDSRHPDPPRPRHIDREAAGEREGSGGGHGGYQKESQTVRRPDSRAPLPPMTLFSKSLSPASALMDTMSGFLAHGRRTFEKERHAWRKRRERRGRLVADHSDGGSNSHGHLRIQGRGNRSIRRTMFSEYKALRAHQYSIPGNRRNAANLSGSRASNQVAGQNGPINMIQQMVAGSN